MDVIYSDPLMFTSYRIGILKQRLEVIASALTSKYLSDVEEFELYDEKTMYEEELSTLQHLYDLLKKGN